MQKKKSVRPLASLHAKLVAGCLVLLGLSLILAAGLLLIIGSDYQRAKKSFDMLHLYREVLIAANKISAERGPTNTLLGGDYPAGSDAVLRLMQFRGATDAALDRVAGLLGSPDAGGRSPHDELTDTRAELARARRVVDEVLAMPFRERGLETIQGAIDGMFMAVDAIRPLISETALSSVEGASGIADEALIGQKLLEIRDYAGRLGSIFTPYIAKRQPLNVADQEKLQQIVGRIRQLWELTRPYLARHQDLVKQIQDVETIFFIDGFEIVNALKNEAVSGNYYFTTGTMTNAIVPTFAPLEAIRLSYLDLMLSRAESGLQAATRWFLGVGILMLAIISIDVILMIGTQRMIFRPLLQARNSIVALAGEKDLDSCVIPASGGGAEIDEVFEALNVLRHKLLERQQLTARFKRQASTDGLTGLPNRRALDQIVAGGAGLNGVSGDIALVLVDLDHFKAVNDRHGHAAGDIVIRWVAALLADNIRKGDFVARYGGEEFAVILAAVTPAQAQDVAEKLRVTIAQSVVDLGGGKTLEVTASFGISVGRRGFSQWNELFQAADAALYEAKATGRNRVVAASAPGG